MLSWLFKKIKGREVASGQRDVEWAKTDTLPTRKDKMKDNERDVNRADAVSLAKEVVSMLEDPQKPLVNKYLYLGPHGASAWEGVEKYGRFPIKEIARCLLEENIDKILDVIKDDSNDAGMDVVSLGTGTGYDDKTILQKLWMRDPEETTFFAVDLGRDLLHRAIKNIGESITRNKERAEATHLRPLCIDISELSTLQDYFLEHNHHRRRLYHLLGLTLGNNNEYLFLNQISAGMLPGDYLLIGVDFCLDNPAWRMKSEKGYADVDWEVDLFVSGPLKTAIALAQSQALDKKFDGVFLTPSGDRCDFLQEEFQIVKKPIDRADKQEPRLSCVPESLSLARFYVPSKFANSKFDALDPTKRKYGKLCDFSNKYKSSAFEQWLREHEGAFGLTLMHEHGRDGIKLWGKEYQYLVLLKKTEKTFIPAMEQLLGNIIRNVDEIFDFYQEMGDTSTANEAKILLTDLKNKNESMQKKLPEISSQRKATLLNFSEGSDNKEKAKEYFDEIRKFISELTNDEL